MKINLLTEQSSNATFLISWADVLSLLLVFFSYIISISTMENDKFALATTSFREALTSNVKTYKYLNSNLKTINQDEFKIKVNSTKQKNIFDIYTSPYKTNLNKEYVIPYNFNKKDLDMLYRHLIQVVNNYKLNDDISITKAQNRVNINLGDKLLFNTGSTEIKMKASHILGKLAKIINSKQASVTIEGHTDNVPINTERFKSNWHLSSIRAAQVLYTLEKNGLDKAKTEIKAYADTNPIAPNTNSANKNKNRRVSISITPYIGES
jgi:chemotaxis protein MotB